MSELQKITFWDSWKESEDWYWGVNKTPKHQKEYKIVGTAPVNNACWGPLWTSKEKQAMRYQEPRFIILEDDAKEYNKYAGYFLTYQPPKMSEEERQKNVWYETLLRLREEYPALTCGDFNDGSRGYKPTR